MSKLAIISCIYEWSRGKDFENKLDYSAHFSDVVHSENDFPSKGIAFISMDGSELNYISAYKKSGRVATKIDRLTFNKPIRVEPSISMESIECVLPASLKRHFQNQTSEGISAFSPKVYQAILEFMKSSRPEVATLVEQLEREMKELAKYKGNALQIAAHEKDAISLALRICGFTDDDIPNWSQPIESAPFLKGYDATVIREDPMVVHDSQVFGDWKKIQQHVVGTAEFIKEGHQLTIMNVNRHKIEEALGVDLLIYHHTYKSYVLIQYKRMTKDGDSLAYRPAGNSYSSEINRMESFRKQVSQSVPRCVSDFRLHSEFFYFKLCPAEIKDPLSTKMISGMYLPLSYWKLLLSSAETRGPRGGRVFSFNTVKRRINNTLFTSLVQDGWIGSQVSNTELITQQIQESIGENKSVILARYSRNESTT